MTANELQEKLRENHLTFIKDIRHLSETDFNYAPTGKWTAGQQLDHIVKSVSPVNMAFSLPVFVLKIILDKANRPSRTFDALIEKYKLKLAAGGRAQGRFIPSQITFADRDAVIKKLHHLTNSLGNRVVKKSEEQLETLILPHPLLGKLTFREMIYFSIYHVKHHRLKVMENLNARFA